MWSHWNVGVNQPLLYERWLMREISVITEITGGETDLSLTPCDMWYKCETSWDGALPLRTTKYQVTLGSTWPVNDLKEAIIRGWAVTGSELASHLVVRTEAHTVSTLNEHVLLHEKTCHTCECVLVIQQEMTAPLIICRLPGRHSGISSGGSIRVTH